jgi:hypothetical protein
MKKFTILSGVLMILLSTSCKQKPAGDNMMDYTTLKEWNLQDIRIRDPFILRDDVNKVYHMYSQKGNRQARDNNDTLRGVEAYTSKDLQTWYGPRDVFTFPENFWANYQVWAPEVFEYKDRYYLFATLSSRDTLPDISPVGYNLPRRGTQVLVSDSPLGPFLPFDNKPHTPVDWSSLDGTLWVEDGIPFMVFCHEWTQILNGSMELIQLSEDLSMPVTEPVTLFHAGDAEWVRGIRNGGMVTDGCFLYQTEGGQLIMIWSSFGVNDYAIGTAISESGKIAGPWVQSDLLFDENGGHGMILETFEGELLLVFHQPNKGPQERAQFYRLMEEDNMLVRGEKLFRD